MRTHPLRGRPTRAEAAAIERRLREAAVEAFVANGFDGTTMEAVASAAGVTKRTLYARFADKQALFAAVIPEALADMPFRGVDLDVPDGDVRDVLRAVARQIVARLVEPQAVRLRRLAVLESHRLAGLDPGAGADLWSTSLRAVVEVLATHAEQGAVVAGDLEVAADLFLAMVAGGPTMWADFGVVRSPEEEARHIDGAVDLFLAGVLPR